MAKGEEGGPFWNGLASVRAGDHWGLVDRTGRWAFEPQFDEVDPLTDSLQVVTKGKKHGLINYAGKLVCPVEYYRIIEFGNPGLTIV